MVSRKWFLTGALALMVSTLAPTKASADWLFTPFIGGTFGGSAKVTGVGGGDLKNEFNETLTYGGSLAFLGGGIAGFEVDFGYSPNFFGSDSNDALNLVGDGNVTTLMANLMIAGPKAAVRPYVVGGVGLVKTRVDSADQFLTDVGNNDFGFDVGGGVIFSFSDNVGIRGDVRYFRGITNGDDNGVDLRLGSFQFWRGTVGVTLRF
jgi:opacity protein-like surface antigen